MDKRGIILFGVGFLVGYMVIRATRNNIVVAPKTESLPNTFAETIPPATAGTVAGTTQIQEPEVIETVEDPEIAFCKEKWIKFAETRKFSSAEQEQATYDNFMTSCVAQS
jgi:hypothetical protein